MGGVGVYPFKMLPSENFCLLYIAEISNLSSLLQYLMPFVEKEGYKVPSGCRLHPDNDLYRDQEQHKHHVDINEWRCGYCRKIFYEEKYLDKHFDNRHFDLLNVVCRLSYHRID